MIQRKQTLFLLLATILGVVAMSFPAANVGDDGVIIARIYTLFYTDINGVAHFDVVWPLFLLLLAASSVCCLAIMMYKKRLLQAMLCIVSIMFFVAWYIALAVYSKLLAPEAMNFHLEWAAVLPAVSAILCFMARKGILADERLVRAADRLR